MRAHDDQTSGDRPRPAWGHAYGFLVLGRGAPRAASADSIADRLEIGERLHRYCWSFDERRADLLADCFTVDGVWEGNVMGQTPIGPFQGAEAIVRWLSAFWPHQRRQRRQRRHMFLNTVIEEHEAGEATALTYLQLLGAADAAVGLETTGFYRVRLRRDDDARWRIAHLFAGFDAPFWPGRLEQLSERARVRHGILR